MADDGLLVTISGAALSLLLYENVRSAGDQMGFLLGEIVEYIVKKFTDTDNQVETVKIHINIETVVTCSMPDILHDSTGRINKEKLKDFISDKSKRVIGWFRFRHNPCLMPTLRDKLLHKQFASHFFGSHDRKEDFFVTCLLSSSVSNTKGTHKFRHVLFRRRIGTFEPVSLKINNLGDGGSALDGSDYKLTPITKSTKETDTFTKIIQSLKFDLVQTSGVELASIIERKAEQYLSTLIPQVCQSDREVYELERQVRELKAKVCSQHLTIKTKVNGNSDTAKRYCEEHKPSLGNVNDPDNIYEDDQPYKYYSLTDASRVHRPSSATNVSAESKPQEKLKMGLDMDLSNSQTHDAFTISAVSDAKLGTITGSTVRMNKGSTNMISPIARLPITMDEVVESGAGRGSPKYGYGAHDLRKGKGGPIISRNNVERNIGESSDKIAIKNSVRNEQPPIPEGISSRDINVRNLSDTSDIH